MSYRKILLASLLFTCAVCCQDGICSSMNYGKNGAFYNNENQMNFGSTEAKSQREYDLNRTWYMYKGNKNTGNKRRKEFWTVSNETYDYYNKVLGMYEEHASKMFKKSKDSKAKKPWELEKKWGESINNSMKLVDYICLQDDNQKALDLPKLIVPWNKLGIDQNGNLLNGNNFTKENFTKENIGYIMGVVFRMMIYYIKNDAQDVLKLCRDNNGEIPREWIKSCFTNKVKNLNDWNAICTAFSRGTVWWMDKGKKVTLEEICVSSLMSYINGMRLCELIVELVNIRHGRYQQNISLNIGSNVIEQKSGNVNQVKYINNQYGGNLYFKKNDNQKMGNSNIHNSAKLKIDNNNGPHQFNQTIKPNKNEQLPENKQGYNNNILNNQTANNSGQADASQEETVKVIANKGEGVPPPPPPPPAPPPVPQPAKKEGGDKKKPTVSKNGTVKKMSVFEELDAVRKRLMGKTENWTKEDWENRYDPEYKNTQNAPKNLEKKQSTLKNSTEKVGEYPGRDEILQKKEELDNNKKAFQNKVKLLQQKLNGANGNK